MDKHFQRHFRSFHDKDHTGHPVYIVEETKREYVGFGITTGEYTNGVKNIPLSKNPEPNNDEQAYVRPKITKVKKGVKNTVKKGWSFSPQDKQIIESLIEWNKKRK